MSHARPGPQAGPPEQGQPGWVQPEPAAKKKGGCVTCLVFAGAFAVTLVVIIAVVGGGKKSGTSAAAPVTATATAAATTTAADSSTPSVPVPQQLRELDIAAGVSPDSQAAYDAAFKTLSSRCREQGVKLGNEVGAILELLQKGNVTDETQLTVMQHVAQSIPPGQKMGCADIGAAYVQMRTGGQ